MGSTSRGLPRHGDDASRAADRGIEPGGLGRSHRCDAALPRDGAGLLGKRGPADPGVRADHAVEQDDEGVLGRCEPAREIDTHDARAAEADREAAIGADHGTPKETRRGETRRARTDEVLRLVGPGVHEVAAVGPDAVQPKVSTDLEAALRSDVLTVWAHAPHARARDKDAERVADG